MSDGRSHNVGYPKGGLETGVVVVLCRGLSSKGFSVLLTIFNRKIMTAVLELAPVRGESDFKPQLQNSILVSLKKSFENFRRAHPSFL